MGQFFEEAAGQLGVPLWLLLIALFWSLIWKAFALWRSARNRHAIWFVALLLVHTMGILEILYIFLFSKINLGKTKKRKK